MSHPQPRSLTTGMLAALGAMAMLGPFGTDTYLPALPAMTDEFGITASQAQLTIVTFTLGMAIGQYVLGALSDRFGRRVVILGGGTLMTLAAILSAMTPNIELLTALCFIMGVSASGGIAGGRAVVADLVHGEAAGRPFAILAMLLGIGPIVGPIAGSVLLIFSGWRSIFLGLALFAAVSTIATATLVPESLTRAQRHKGGMLQILKTSGRVLANAQFRYNAMILWFGFGLLFAYVASSSFIVQDVLGLSPTVYAISFGVNGIALVLASLFTAKFSSPRMMRRFLHVGLGVQIASVALLAFIVLTDTYSDWLVLFTLFVVGTTMGFVFGPATTRAMLDVRFAAGTASALLGSIQFIIAAIVTATLSVIPDNAVVGLFVVGSISIAFALVSLIAASQVERKRDVIIGASTKTS